MNALTIPQMYLSEGKEKAKHWISSEKIHEYIKLLDKKRKKNESKVMIRDKNSKDSIKSLESLLTNFFAIEKTLSEFFSETKIDHKTLIYSALKISNQGLSYDEKSNFQISNDQLTFEDQEKTARKILNLFKTNIFEKEISSENIYSRTKSFHASIDDALDDMDYTDVGNNIRIIIEEEKHNKKSYRSKNNRKEKINFDIGNEDVRDFLSIQNRLLGCYDPDSQENPILDEYRPRVILLIGKPGTGKTEAIKQANDELEKITSYKKTGCNIVLLDNSFWDKYLGESNKMLRKNLNEVKEKKTINRLIIDDCESIIPRRDSETAGESGRRIIKELLSFIDCVDYDYYGNYDIIMATNYKEMIDDALLSRVTHEVEVYGPRTKQQYCSAFFERLLSGWEKWIEVDKEERERCSEKLFEKKYSARNLFSLSVKIKDMIRNPEKYRIEDYRMEQSEFRNHVMNYFKKVNADEIKKII